MIIEVYDAFKSVGVDDDTARRAAGALSDNQQQLGEFRTEMERRFDQVERRFDQTQAEIDRRFSDTQLVNEKRFSKIEADLLVMKWMTGAIVAGVLSLVAKTFL